MKKQKQVAPFAYKDLTNKQVVDIINIDLPISLRYNEDLINRIHARYSVIDKAQISIIVKAVFSSIREFLMLGFVQNYNKLFFDTKLLFFTHQRNGDIFPAVKVEMTTPPKLKGNKK